MPARTWFTAENTADVDAADLAIMNRAIRAMHAPGVLPNFGTLSFIRQTYKAGMSARELVDAAEKEEQWRREVRRWQWHSY